MAPKKVYPKRSGKVAPAVKQYVKNQMRTNTELKRYEAQDQEKLEGLTASATVPMFTHNVLLLAQGTASNERIGNEIRLQGVQLKGMFNNNTTLTTYVRIMIGYYIGNAELTSPVSEIVSLFKDNLGNSVSAQIVAAAGAKNYALMTTPTHPEFWHPLYDKVLKIGPNTSTDGNNTRLFNKFIKLHNKKVIFDTLSGTTGAGYSTPRLQVIRIYTDAPQDSSTAQTLEYSGLSQVWYRDA